MKNRALILSLLLLAAPSGLGVLGGCTLKPCIEDACEPTRAQITGDWAQDILGQWVDDDIEQADHATSMEEYREGGMLTQVVLCDHGDYVTPGSTLESSYSLKEGELSISSGSSHTPPPTLVEEIGAETMVLQEPVLQKGGEFTYKRVAKRRVRCDL